MNLPNAIQKVFYVFLLIEYQIGKLLSAVDEYQPVVEICGGIIRLNHGIASECSFNILIRAVILHPEVIVVHALFAEPYSAFGFCRAVIRIMNFVAQLRKGPVRPLELINPIGKELVDYLQCLPPFCFPFPLPFIQVRGGRSAA